MRREGYEFEVGRPQVVTIEKDGKTQEPVEELVIEIGNEFVGTVSQEMGVRRGELIHQESDIIRCRTSDIYYYDPCNDWSA